MNDSVETPAILSEILPSIDLKREGLGKKRGHKNKQAHTFPGKNQVNILVKINRPTFNFLQLAVQKSDVSAIRFNDLLKR